jgi:hypothetical protein
VGVVTGPTTAKSYKRKTGYRLSKVSYPQNIDKYWSTEYIFQPCYAGPLCYCLFECYRLVRLVQ